MAYTFYQEVSKHAIILKTKLLTSRINNDEGYSSVVICTAKEVLDDEQDDED